MDEILSNAFLLPLKIIEDPRGAILHMIRLDSPAFTRFGEVYFSEVASGAVKAWRRHSKMVQRFVVPSGRVRIALYDGRPNSGTFGKTAVIILSRRSDEYRLLVVPPGIWYGFEGLEEGVSLIANCPDLPHDPSEIERLEPRSEAIPYQWEDHKEGDAPAAN